MSTQRSLVMPVTPLAGITVLALQSTDELVSLMLDLKTLITEETPTDITIEFKQKMRALFDSEDKLDKAIIDIAELVLKAKKELDTPDMKALLELINAKNKAVIDPATLPYNQLKTYCKMRGISPEGKTKEALMKELISL